MKYNLAFIISMVFILSWGRISFAQESISNNRTGYSSDLIPATAEIDALNPLNYIDKATEWLSATINDWITKTVEDLKFAETGTNLFRIYGRVRTRWKEQSNYDFDRNQYDLQHFQNHFARFGISAITTEFRIDFEFFHAIEIFSTRIYGIPDEDSWDIHRLTFMLTGFEKDRIRFPIPFTSTREWADLLIYFGRGPITLGRGRIIGSNDWLNKGDVFDEVVLSLILENSGASLSFFGVRSIVYENSRINDSEYGTEIWGVALIGADPFDQLDDVSEVEQRGLLRPGHYNFDYFPVNNSEEHRSIIGIDLYTLWVYRDRNDVESELGRVGNYNFANIGMRVGIELVSNWIFEFEGNYQVGKYGNSDLRAFAIHTEINGGFQWMIPVSFTASVDYASGDSNPKDGVVETFYDLYGNIHSKFGKSDMFGWRNLLHLGFNFRFQIDNTISISTGAHLLENAQVKDAIYGPRGSVFLDKGVGEPFKTIGYSLDAELQYHYSKRIHVYAGVSHFQPGSKLKSVLLDDYALQYYIIGEIRY
ncbi:MAG: alginate export family protein [Planctomycetes bacterium]|nr:alginate export family protein [Planctomycetota bacterium]